MKPLIQRLLHLTGTNRAIAFGVFTKMWSVVSGPISLILISRFFTPALQGYYYTFSSLLALQFFVELGLGQVLVQFVSHEATHLQIASDGNVSGDATALGRLVSLGRMSFKWYAAMSLLFTLAFAITGVVFFGRQASSGVAWHGPWLSFSFFAGVSLLSTPALFLLEGSNQVRSLNLLRLIQGILASVAIWAGVAAGAGLWVSTLSQIASVSVTVFFVLVIYRKFFSVFWSGAVRAIAGVSWRKEIWPMQWRIALSWISGYFSFYFFTPVIFHYHGATEAGRLGMTWTILSALNGVAGMWTAVQVPTFGMLIARKSYAQLDRLFFRATLSAFMVALSGGAAWCGIIVLLARTGHSFAMRCLPVFPTALFAAGVAVLQLNGGIAFYLRAHKREPLFIMSVIRAILTGSAIFFLGKHYGVNGLAVGYLSIVLLLLPVEATIWRICRRDWHSA